MIRHIARKELSLNLVTFKFAVGTIVSLILTVVFVPILAKDYQQRLKNYSASVASNEEKLSKVKVYKNIKPTIYQRPSVLSVFTEGLEKQIGKSAKVKPDDVPEILTTSEVNNPFLSAFPTLDVTLIFKVVMSVLAILVAYDMIAGEREQGTLRLMLSGKASRYQILLGKLLAGLVTLSIPTTGAFIVGLIALQVFPMVNFSGIDWIRAGLMFLTSLIFISAMYNVGLLFSCLMRRSSISLVFGLFVWIVCSVVIPNTSVYLAHYLRPIGTREAMDAHVKTLIEERDKKITELTKTLGTSGQQSFGIGPYGNFVLFCDERLLANYSKMYALSTPIRTRYADRIFEVQQHYLAGRSKQKVLAGIMIQFSPVVVYENVMSVLAGTDLGGQSHFRDEVKAYSNEVIEYVRSKTDNFSSPIYFTPTPKEDHPKMMKELASFMSKDKALADKDSFFERFQKWQDQKVSPLNLHDFPRFISGHEPLSHTLKRALPQIMLLLLINALFFTLSFVAFLKYDVR